MKLTLKKPSSHQTWQLNPKQADVAQVAQLLVVLVGALEPTIHAVLEAICLATSGTGHVGLCLEH